MLSRGPVVALGGKSCKPKKKNRRKEFIQYEAMILATEVNLNKKRCAFFNNHDNRDILNLNFRTAIKYLNNNTSQIRNFGGIDGFV